MAEINIDVSTYWAVGQLPCKSISTQFVASNPSRVMLPNRNFQTVALVSQPIMCKLLETKKLILPADKNNPAYKDISVGIFHPLSDFNQVPPPVDPPIKRQPFGQE